MMGLRTAVTIIGLSLTAVMLTMSSSTEFFEIEQRDFEVPNGIRRMVRNLQLNNASRPQVELATAGHQDPFLILRLKGTALSVV